jgi:hypothetical protein
MLTVAQSAAGRGHSAEVILAGEVRFADHTRATITRY